jgi:hypothetical protein
VRLRALSGCGKARFVVVDEATRLPLKVAEIVSRPAS